MYLFVFLRSESRLRKDRAVLSDGGTYLCLAENIGGNKTQRSVVTITDGKFTFRLSAFGSLFTLILTLFNISAREGYNTASESIRTFYSCDVYILKLFIKTCIV